MHTHKSVRNLLGIVAAGSCALSVTVVGCARAQASGPDVSVAVFAGHYVLAGRAIDDLDVLDDAVGAMRPRSVRLDACGDGRREDDRRGRIEGIREVRPEREPYGGPVLIIHPGGIAPPLEPDRIGTQDLKIAAIVLEQDALLLSRNTVDFERVPGLRVESWLD